jgi:hypothetical protein
MKTKINFLTACVVLALSTAITSNAQIGNLQIHKELGSFKINDSTKVKRDGFRAKFEMIGFDSLGTYYWNTQISYSTNDKNVGAQVQILRGIKFSRKAKVQALFGHSSAVGTTSQWYIGAHYPFTLGRVRFLPFIAYTYNKDQKSADFRFTSGITANLAKNKILVFGFVNAYTKDKRVGDGSFTKEIGFQANPQVWMRFSKKIAVGSEINVDYLKSRYQSLIIIPTAAARWVF